MESMLGFTLVALLVVLILNLVPASIVSSKRGERRYRAEMLAQSVLEETAARPFGSLRVGDPQRVTRGEDEGYTTTLQIFTLPDSNPKLVLGARAEVSWQDGGHQMNTKAELYLSGLPR
jgi:hypothetical protein